jgi:Spy/CpxP family protein refolding chaperone
MKPWIKRTLFGLFGVTVLLGGLTACGHHRHGEGWQLSAEDQAQRRSKMVERVAGKLDLNDDQKTRLGVLADKLHEQRLALMGAGADPRAQLQALVAGDKFESARAQALIGEKIQALNAKSPEVVAAMASFYDSLTPEQQAKVRAFMQGRHRGWGRG